MKIKIRLFVITIMVSFVFCCNSLPQSTQNNKTDYKLLNEVMSQDNIAADSIIKVIFGINSIPSENKIHYLNYSNNQQTYYIYSTEGYLLEIKTIRLIGNIWEDFLSTKCTYDNNGNMLTLKKMKNENGSWNIQSTFSAEYDSNNNAISYEEESWRYGDLWMKNKYLKTYYSSNMLKELIFQQWGGGAWKNSTRKTYVYNELGSTIETEYFNWQGTGWNPLEKNEFTYNAQNKIVAEIIKRSSNGTYSIYCQTNYEYDSFGNLISTEYKQSNNGTLKLYSKETRTYNNQSQMLTQIIEGEYSGKWTVLKKNENEYLNGKIRKETINSYYEDTSRHTREYSYDVSGNCVKIEKLFSSLFVSQRGIRNSFEYDSHGNRITDVEEIYENGSWILFEKRTNEYSEDGLLLMQLNYQWSNGKWDKESKKVYNYNEFKNCTMGSHYSFYDGEWKKSAGELNIVYNSEIDTIKCFEELVIVEYKKFTDTKSDNMVNEFCLSQNYPNPFNPSTTIKYSIPFLNNVEIKLYNSLGQEIKTLLNEEKGPGSYEIKINMSGLSSGIYFYRLISGGSVHTKKMLLLK